AGRVDADPAVQHAVGAEAAGKTRRLLGEHGRRPPAEGDGDAAGGLEKVAAFHGATSATLLVGQLPSRRWPAAFDGRIPMNGARRGAEEGPLGDLTPGDAQGSAATRP